MTTESTPDDVPEPLVISPSSSQLIVTCRPPQQPNGLSLFTATNLRLNPQTLSTAVSVKLQHIYVPTVSPSKLLACVFLMTLGQ